jgi:glutaredoxin
MESAVTVKSGDAAGMLPAAAASIKTKIGSSTLAVFGSSWCPHSIEAIRVCEALHADGGCNVTYLDKTDPGGEMRAALKQMTQHSTVPYVFINGVSLTWRCPECDAPNAMP